MIQRNFNLHLYAGHQIPLVINCNQYDSGEQWLFTLYNGAVQHTPSSGAIVGIKSDRLGIINTGTVDGNGRVVINETRQMTAAVGKNVFELLIDDQTHGTANFMVLVEPRPGDNADLSESDYSLFEEAIQGTSQAAIKAGVQEWMDENLTDPTDPIVDASLSLSGAAADAKKTGDEISALKSAIDNLSVVVDTENIVDGAVTKEKLSSDIDFGDKGLPILYLTGSLDGISKENKVNLLYTYIDKNNDKEITGWCTLKWQGQTSINWNKHNFKIQFYKDPYYHNKDKINMGFGKQSKYTLKSNYNDYSMARNVVSSELWGDIVKTRNSYPKGLSDTPNHGAVDGFPFLIYLNDEFYGLYDMNVDKDWMTDLDEDNPLHALVGGSVQGEAVRFISVNNLASWEIEIPDVMSADTRTALTALINFVVNSTDEEFVADLDQYIDVESVIDYICFTWFIGATDNLGKNIYLMTYDNTKWYMTAYDLDATFGNVWNGGLTIPYDTPFPDGSGATTAYEAKDNRLFIRMLDLYGEQILAKYTALRKTVLSLKYVTDKIHRFMSKIDDTSRYLDRQKWGTKAWSESGALSEAFMVDWITRRSKYVDSHVKALIDGYVPCEGISLSSSTLYFDSSSPKTLTATTTPSDASDDVIWTCSNTNVCTVSQSGVVTPVNSGTATITVECGEYSANCTVTVSDDIIVWSSTTGYKGNADGTWDYDVTQSNHSRYMTTKDVNLKLGHNYTFAYGYNYADMIVYDQNDNPIEAVSNSGINRTIIFGAMPTLDNRIPTRMKLFAMNVNDVTLTDNAQEWSLTPIYFNTQNGKIVTDWEKTNGLEADTTGYQTFKNYPKFDLIEVTEGEVYTLTGKEPMAAFYDTNSNYLSFQRTGGVTTVDVTVPANAKYMRLFVQIAAGDPNGVATWTKKSGS